MRPGGIGPGDPRSAMLQSIELKKKVKLAKPPA